MDTDRSLYLRYTDLHPGSVWIQRQVYIIVTPEGIGMESSNGDASDRPGNRRTVIVPVGPEDADTRLMLAEVIARRCPPSVLADRVQEVYGESELTHYLRLAEYRFLERQAQ